MNLKFLNLQSATAPLPVVKVVPGSPIITALGVSRFKDAFRLDGSDVIVVPGSEKALIPMAVFIDPTQLCATLPHNDTEGLTTEPARFAGVAVVVPAVNFPGQFRQFINLPGGTLEIVRGDDGVPRLSRTGGGNDEPPTEFYPSSPFANSAGVFASVEERLFMINPDSDGKHPLDLIFFDDDAA